DFGRGRGMSGASQGSRGRNMAPRASIITLGVKDLHRSYRCYKDGLGLPTSRKPEEGIVFFQTLGVCLALYPYESLADDVGEAFQGPRSKFPGITLAYNCRSREEVDEVIQLAVS